MLRYNGITPIWILSNPRVGSCYLVDLLNLTGLFNPGFAEHYLRIGATLDDPYDRKLPLYNKIHWQYFARYIGKTNLEGIIPTIKYIRIRRLDYVEVAVSHYFAKHLQQFVLKKYQGEPNQQLLEYDEPEILRLYYCAKEWDAKWDNYLEKRPHFKVEYEDLIANPQAIIDSILCYVNMEPVTLNLDSTNLAIKLSHPQKAEFVERFRVCLARNFS